LKRNNKGVLILHVGSKKFIINKNVPKQKLASFIKNKVSKLGFEPKKIAFKRIAKRAGRPPKPQKMEMPSLRSKMPRNVRVAKRIPYQRKTNIEKALEQVEQQQQHYFNPYESEISNLSREALVSFAISKGIKTAPRLTKNQIISEISKLQVEEQEISEKKKRDLERKQTLENSPWNAYGINILKKIAGKNRLKNYQNLNKLTLIERLEKKGIKPPKMPFTEADVRGPKPARTYLTDTDDELAHESEIKQPIIERRVPLAPKPPKVTIPQLKQELQSLGVKIKSTWDKAELIRQLAIAKSTVKPAVKPAVKPVIKPPPVVSSPSPWDTPEEDDEPPSPGERKTKPPQTEEEEEYSESVLTDQDGDGRAMKTANDGISNIDLEKIMKPYGSEWLGCYSCDEMGKLLNKVQPQSRGCAIINTSPSNSEGEHWICTLWDARDKPEASQSIEFFDSYGDDPDPIIDQGIKRIAQKLDGGKYLKYKINSVKFQGEKKGTGLDSGNCGYHCLRFLADRLRNKSFAECTGFDNSSKGEEHVEKFKKVNGLARQRGWGYLPSFLRRPDSMVEQIKSAIFFPAKELSVPFKKFMAKYGDYAITNAKIRRQPISWAIDKLLNVISFGTWSQGKKELNYPDLFHLGIMLELRRGGDTKNVVLEKLERPHFTESWKDDSNVEYVPVILKQPSGKRAFPSLNEFIQKTIDKIGIHRFVVYGGMRSINCQNFIMDLLDANNSLTPQAKAFIYQPIEELVKKMPSWVDKISQGVTDFSARARQFFGVGRKLRLMRSQATMSKVGRGKFRRIQQLHELAKKFSRK
jgi:hypothetical protein